MTEKPEPPTSDPRRAIPSVEYLLSQAAGEPLLGRYGREACRRAIRETLDAIRDGEASEVPDPSAILERVARTLGADDDASRESAEEAVRTVELEVEETIHRSGRIVQNIGGIANVTFLPPAYTAESIDVLAFDTGPGNMLIDEAARFATNNAWSYDRDGLLAVQGHVDESLLEEWLAEPFFHQRPPRTTGRELFGAQRAAEYFSQAIQRRLGPNDIIATLTALTARSIYALDRNCESPMTPGM